jgi:ribosome-binding protein aMBF1 (putative translation factor)
MPESDTERESQFSSWLVESMERRRLRGSELARLVQEQLPAGVQFSASNISHYRSGRSVPRALVREVIEKILDAKAAAAGTGAGTPFTAPDAQAQNTASEGEKIQVQDIGSGRARVIIDQQVPWAEALELIKLLKLTPSRH